MTEELYDDENTLFKVDDALRLAGIAPIARRDAISQMLNKGILFRERKAVANVVRVVKKPIEVDAVQFTGGVQTATGIINWILENDGVARYHEPIIALGTDKTEEYLSINTLEGAMSAHPGDWIIKGVKGEFYPCKPDIFNETYAEVLGKDFKLLDPSTLEVNPVCFPSHL